MIRRLAMVVGDTAGHVNPALAIAETYRKMFGEVDVLFLAAGGGPASRLIPASGYDLELVPASPLVRTGLAGRVAAVARVAPCFARARRVLRGRGTRLVIGSGGYASGGVLLAARSLRLATALIEPNVQPGLANRLLKRVAERAYFTFPEAARTFPPDRTLLTGTPVVQALTAPDRAARQAPRAGQPIRILVASGSRGAEWLASRVPLLLGRLRERGVQIEVRHQAGASLVDHLRQTYTSIGVIATVVPHIDDMAGAYDWAHFAIVRAGAGSLAELALAGLPALLVPLADAAEGHQAANARRFAAAGAAIQVDEADWDNETLAAELEQILLQASSWEAMVRSAQALATPDAATRIVDDCERVMRGRW